MCTLLLPNDCPLPVASVEIYFSVSWAGDLKWFGSKSEIIWQEWENLRQLRMEERGGRVALRKLHNSTTDRCPHSQLILTRINWFSTHTYTRNDGTILPLCSLGFNLFSDLVSQLSRSDTFRSSCTHRWHFFCHLFLSIFSPSFCSFLFFSSCPNSLWPSYLWLASVSGASHEIARKPGLRWSSLSQIQLYYSCKLISLQISLVFVT